MEGARGVTAIVVAYGLGDPISDFLGEAVGISHSAKTFGKIINPTIPQSYVQNSREDWAI